MIGHTLMKIFVTKYFFLSPYILINFHCEPALRVDPTNPTDPIWQGRMGRDLEVQQCFMVLSTTRPKI
jgi:hypothetical protein